MPHARVENVRSPPPQTAGSLGPVSAPLNSNDGSQEQSNGLDKRPDLPLKVEPWTIAAYPHTPRWTRETLDKERQEFFDTRVTGNPGAWQAIRSAMEVLWDGGDAMDNDGGLATAQQILTGSGLTLPTGHLHGRGGAYDQSGQRYKLKRYHVSDPTDLEDAIAVGSDEDGKRAVSGDLDDSDKEDFIEVSFDVFFLLKPHLRFKEYNVPTRWKSANSVLNDNMIDCKTGKLTFTASPPKRHEGKGKGRGSNSRPRASTRQEERPCSSERQTRNR